MISNYTATHALATHTTHTLYQTQRVTAS